MNDLRIQSQDVTIHDLFNSFYAIPQYQREYVWKDDQVKQILLDLQFEFESDDRPEYRPEYFLGSIVVCPQTDNTLEVIDGQQRITTLFVLICALRDQILSTHEKSSDDIFNSKLCTNQVNADGTTTKKLRVELQYDDSGDVLQKLVDDGIEHINENKTTSIENILGAYQIASEFLSSNGYTNNHDHLRQFYAYLLNKVKLIRILTRDLSKALKIFETVNDRGVGLSPVDLLKNLLFIESDKSDHEKLADLWKKINDSIFNMKEKPLRVIRYVLMANYHVGKGSGIIRETDVYDWFKNKENKSQTNYVKEPIKFTQHLLHEIQTYSKYLIEKVDNFGNKSQIENFSLLGGSSARQHLILLLAASHLSETTFNQLAREVENTMFVMLLIKERSQIAERLFTNWSQELRKLDDGTPLSEFIESTLKSYRTTNAERFQLEMRNLVVDKLPKYRVRYILAKIEQYLQQIVSRGPANANDHLSIYIDAKSYALEHIYPQNPSEEAKVEFGSTEDSRCTQMLGNVILLETSINSSIGNRPYSQKIADYQKSNLYLVKNLYSKQSVGQDTKINKAISLIESYQVWNENNIHLRQKNIYEIACKVWNIDRVDYEI